MATYQTQGIIFRNIKYGESSIICDIFTKEKGLRSFIVSGVRSSKSKTKAGLYRPLHIVELMAYDAIPGKLARIKEIQFSKVYKSINIHVIKSAMALFMLEVARNAIREEHHDEELYHFIESSLINLDLDSEASPATHILFMVQLSTYLGFEPMQNHDENRTVFDLLNGSFESEETSIQYKMDKEAAWYFKKLIGADNQKLEGEVIPKSIRYQLLDDLLLYYKLHVPGFKDIVSKDVLTAVLV